MAGQSKFVSIGLAITLLVLTVAAMFACWIPMPAMSEMAMGDAGSTNTPLVSIEGGPVSSSCCGLSAANSPPFSVPQAPENGAASMAKTASTPFLDAPARATRTEAARAQLRGSGSSLQASLCTFLI